MASSVTSQVAAANLRQCSYCQHWKLVCDENRLWQAKWYCSSKCSHDAGDHEFCEEGCGCSGYAKKRRQLRSHRVEMRVMENLIKEEDLEEEMLDRICDETGYATSWGLDHIESMDGSSDSEEDPEAALRQELADQSAFVEAASGALQYRKVATDLERARMMLEDVCSRQLQ